MFKIKILPNGPYLVKDLKRLVEETSKRKGRILKAVETKEFDKQDEYHLCRCGFSSDKPFCDGAHAKVGFNGKETADKALYEDRADIYNGPEMDLMDDNRCSFARFCHRERAEVWTLTKNSDDAENMREAIEGASACPAGRLTAVVDDEPVEEKYEPIMAIAQDLEEGVSAGIYVRGNFELEGADGEIYEKRNRISLCRCGASSNKPFCDATHVRIGFNDQKRD